MSGFDNFNTDFYQTSYSIDDQTHSYDYSGSEGPYNKQYSGYDYSQQSGFVPPEMMQQQQPYTGQIYQPTQTYTPTAAQSFYGSSFEDEPPLLEELGINFDHIWQKTLTVLHPLKVADGSIMNETDLAGPMVFCLAFGATLLLCPGILSSSYDPAFQFCSYIFFARDDGNYSHGWNYWMVQFFCFQNLHFCLSNGRTTASSSISLCFIIRSLRSYFCVLN
ncbi:protein YIPF5 isoform X2 [Emydura macquarii macquarii]|uniref:protein YIPF5 isoform X2 n=1 Tax=Emydura macquarii macquarii TaxID=1129001 RepID=UPI00352A9047